MKMWHSHCLTSSILTSYGESTKIYTHLYGQMVDQAVMGGTLLGWRYSAGKQGY
jgi:hypothetical protein